MRGIIIASAITAGIIILLVLAAALVCYLMVFRSPRRQTFTGDEYDLPQGEVYEPHWEQMKQWQRMIRNMPCREMSVVSFDGLTLRGRYYECDPNAPIELMFHGYKGTAERDMSGGVARSFSVGHNALLIEQRGACRSEGNTITFGVREYRDCLTWTEYAVQQFGKDCRLILAGISMGASTVIMAGGNKLPPNVKYILADCGFSSPREIIRKVMKDRKLPVKLVYPVVRLGALLFGGFDPEEWSPVEAVKRCEVPVILFHGEADDFVPCEMSRQIYDACTAPKKLVTIPGAGHGLAYPVDPEGYIAALTEFKQQCGV